MTTSAANKQTDGRCLVHTPVEMVCDYLSWADQARKGAGITFGIKPVDEHVIPMRAGNLVAFMARPGHCKTAMLAYLARHTAQQLRDAGDTERVVVYVTWEQSAEELAAIFLADEGHTVSDVAWGRTDEADLQRHASKAVSLPLWLIGHGIQSYKGARVPRMTPDIVLGAIESMHADFGVKPALMLFDYLQLIPVNNASERMEQVTEAPIRVKELAMRIGCPAVVGVQARREVDDREVKLPELRDAQWASSIEQTCDKVFGLWRPALTEPPNSFVDVGDRKLPVTDRLMLMRMLKQRGDVGSYTWIMHFAPEYLRLAEMELHNAV